jgi:hypothetical protein
MQKSCSTCIAVKEWICSGGIVLLARPRRSMSQWSSAVSKSTSREHDMLQLLCLLCPRESIEDADSPETGGLFRIAIKLMMARSASNVFAVPHSKACSS